MLLFFSSDRIIFKVQNWFLATAKLVRSGENMVDFTFYISLNLRKLQFRCALLCVANPSRSSTNDSAKFPAFELHGNFGFSVKLDEIDTHIWTSLYPSCSIGIAKNIFLHKKWLKIEICHVLQELLVIGVRDREQASFVKPCFSQLIHIPCKKHVEVFLCK